MLNPFFCILTHAFLERNRVYHISNILIYERIPAISNKVSPISESENRTYLGMSASTLSPYPFFSVKTISILAYCFCWNLERWEAKISLALRESSITPFTSDSGSMTDNGNPLEDIPPGLTGWCSRRMARMHCQCYRRLWETRKTMNEGVATQAHAKQPTTVAQ